MVGERGVVGVEGEVDVGDGRSAIGGDEVGGCSRVAGGGEEW